MNSKSGRDKRGYLLCAAAGSVRAYVCARFGGLQERKDVQAVGVQQVDGGGGR